MPRAAAWSAVVRPAIPLPRTRTSYTVRSLRRRAGAGRHSERRAPRGRRRPRSPRIAMPDVVDEAGRAEPGGERDQHRRRRGRSIGRSSSASRTSTYSRSTRGSVATVSRTIAATHRRIALARRDGVGGRRAALGTSTGAARRSSGERYALRLDSASPSASRTSGQPTTSTGRLRSSVMRRTTASCCASLRPKYARHGPTIENSFVDDGRDAVEVRRPRRAAQVGGQPGDVHGRQRRARVHLRDVGREHAVARRLPRTAGDRSRGRAGSGRGPRSGRTAAG